MIGIAAVTALFAGLDVAELLIWVEHGWVQPEQATADWLFHEVDVARVGLIHDLSRRMAVNDEAVGLALSLLDQLHETRGELRALLRVIEGSGPESDHYAR